MSVYSPTQLLPNATSVDASATPLTLYWNYNSSNETATPQTDYQIKIYSLANSLVYDSTKTTSSNEYHAISSTPLTNGQTYKYQLETWSGANSAKSPWTLLYANASSTLTLSATPSTQQYYNFTCTYNQAEDIPLLTYEANLYLTSTQTTAIDTSGIIYPTTLVGDGDTISYAFDGMESGTNYSVEFTAITQRGETITTGLIPFSISYSYPPNISELVVTTDDVNGTISLDWLALKQILGTVEGSYSYVDGRFNKGLQLDAGSTLYYDTETIPDDFTLYLWINIPSGFTGTIAQFGTSGTGMRVFFNGSKFGFQHGNFITIGRTASGVVNEFTFIGIKYRKIIIKTATHEEIIDI